MNEICGPSSVSIRGFGSRQYHYGREESETVLCRAIAGKSEPERRNFAWTNIPSDVDCLDCRQALAFIAGHAIFLIDDSPHLARAMEKLKRASKEGA